MDCTVIQWGLQKYWKLYPQTKNVEIHCYKRVLCQLLSVNNKIELTFNRIEIIKLLTFLKKWIILKERLNGGTVPLDKTHPGGTVPLDKTYPWGTIPPDKTHPGETVPPYKTHTGSQTFFTFNKNIRLKTKLWLKRLRLNKLRFIMNYWCNKFRFQPLMYSPCCEIIF